MKEESEFVWSQLW